MDWSGVWVINSIFITFSVMNILDLARVLVRSFESDLYMRDVTTAELQCHLSKINVLRDSNQCFDSDGVNLNTYLQTFLQKKRTITATSYERYVVTKIYQLGYLSTCLFILTNMQHQSSAFVRGVRRWPVDSPSKGLVIQNVAMSWSHHDVEGGLSSTR